ncbi:dihydrofolate reductase family protein [Pelagibacterium xiamenense]|uniref:dihydrofolate reductase family protein n=1 Tax=Pelagibacterium xiamenense TaxID=2901140 RepID=UPI001E4179BC|nr:dihydrofolate reductase family protein [Pelagibacterium xiamenense]MCD7060625.1 dihydrofolate reductase family protein [Pelagibacterium xiamenense]
MSHQIRRKIVVAIQVSLDGFTEGPFGENEWVESWADAAGLVEDLDAFIVGGRMYPAYGLHWQGIFEDPEAPAPFMERMPTPQEVDYARKAFGSAHYVMSRSLEAVEWPPTATITNISQLQEIKARKGGNIYVAGGATLIAALLDAGLVDEIRLIVHPVALGRGTGLFADISNKVHLDLIDAKPDPLGRAVLSYRVLAEGDKRQARDCLKRE